MLSEIFSFKNTADFLKNNSSQSFNMHIPILYGAKIDVQLLSEIEWLSVFVQLKLFLYSNVVNVVVTKISIT